MSTSVGILSVTGESLTGRETGERRSGNLKNYDLLV